MTITTLPALNRSSPTFKADVDTFFGSQLPTFSTEVNTEIDRINQISFGSYSATSTTNLTIGTGTKNLTIETGKGFTAGQAIIVAETATPANYMAGQVTSYNSGTGALVLNSTVIGGSGTASAWSVSVTAINAATETVGTVYTGTDAPTDGTWLEINGDVYLQSSYPALCSEIGLVANQPASSLSWVNNAGITVAQTGVTWTGSEFVTAGTNGGTTGYRLGATGSGATTITYPSNNMQTIASNGLTVGNITVALASSGTATARSTDGGATWAAGGTVSTGNYQVCTFANNQFVAVAQNALATSPTGVTWTNRTFTGLNATSIAYVGSNTWVAGVASGNITRSTDNAVTWSGALIATGLDLVNDLSVFNGLLIAVGRIGGNAGAITVSKDLGLTWQIVHAGVSAAYQNVASGDGIVVAIGNGFASYSMNGYTWVTTSSPGATIAGSVSNALAYGNGRFVSVSNAATNGAQYLASPVLSYNISTQFSVGVPGNASYKQWVKAE